MPNYIYYCPTCSEEMEKIHPIEENPTILCPLCGVEMRKKICASRIVWGQGFFKMYDVSQGKEDKTVFYPDGHSREKTYNESFADGVGI